jgi:hypothetical protein
MEGADADRVTVMAALRRLGVDPGDGRDIPIERLSGGLSGASVLRVEVDGRAMVLKLTSPGADGVVRERAERESHFYRGLAASVPVQVPELIGQASGDGEGTLLLLAAYPPAPPLVDWKLADYERVARDLGMLHGTFWGVVPGDLPGWLGTVPRVLVDMAGEASSRWAGLDVDDALLPLRRAAELTALEVPRLDRERERLPLTLCHGDAHRDNLLRGESGAWVWADWQEVRLREGVGDLSFFWQRAFAVTDSVPPVEGLLGAYGEGLSQAGVSKVSEADLGQAVAWSELVSWLIAWPPYLGWLEPGVRGRVLQRIEALLRQLEIGVR